MKLNLSPIVVTGVAVSAPIPTDSRLNATQLGVSIVVSATATYTIQYTLDDPYAAGGIVNWYTATTTPATTAASNAYTITQVCTAVRLNVSASTGTVSIQVWQTDSAQGA